MANKGVRCNVVVYGFILTYVVLYWALLRRTNNDKLGEIFPHPNPIAANITRRFSPENGDAMVLFHMQKTGGSEFNKNLVKINNSSPCDCFVSPPDEGGCRCRNSQGYTWLFSRFTMSSACGVHPPLQELKNCVPKYLAEADGYSDGKQPRFLFTTVLRSPIKRYLSEWQHIQKVGPWPSGCKEGDTVKACLEEHGQQISLKDFINCPGNPANNRQVRMLASDSLNQCEDQLDEQSYTELLERAKTALRNMDFFGVTDHQIQTQSLFELTFGINFMEKFTDNRTSIAHEILTSPTMEMDLVQDITEKNKLDIALYKYAKDLFYYRYNVLKQYKP